MVKNSDLNEDGPSIFQKFASKITYENKTIIGIISIILGIVFWAISNNGIGLFYYFLIMLPGIFLVIPSESVKNSKILGIFAMIISFIFIVIGIEGIINPDSFINYSNYSYMWFFDSTLYSRLINNIIIDHSLLLIYSLFELFATILLFINTPKSINVSNSNDTVNNGNVKFSYCPNCGTKLENNSSFCSKCGRKL